MSTRDLSDFSMTELFQAEVESQGQLLTAALLALETMPEAADQLEACMRSAHSLKGAARIVGLDAGVRVAHAMEDCFVAAQNGRLVLSRKQIDVLLRGVDLLTRIARTSEADAHHWNREKKAEVDSFLVAITLVREDRDDTETNSEQASSAESFAAVRSEMSASSPSGVVTAGPDTTGRVLRVTADNLNRLLGLAGESLVESRWLKPFAESLLRLKRLHHDLGRRLDALRETLPTPALDESAQAAIADAQRQVLECGRFLSQRLAELDVFDHRSANLARRLYDEALAVRMRPFADGIQSFPRLVRDLGLTLGKDVHLRTAGETTQVDRDILEKLEAPLGHLLRNAIDHGIETPGDRAAAGKPRAALLQLEARHSAGLLQIVVADDGRGIDLDRVRAAVVARKLTTEEIAQKLSDAELLEFLFLPGFTLKETVTEISGRGVGLDVVNNMVKQVHGTVRVLTHPGKGTRFQLQLPLTLSVVRTLLVQIGGEPYAFPLAYITRTLMLPKARIELLEGRQHFNLDGRQIGLVTAHQVLASHQSPPADDEWPIIVMSHQHGAYGLVVDRFLGERELVVQPLDPRLGKIQDVAASALMADGAPVLIVDVDDVLRTVEKLVASGSLNKVQPANRTSGVKPSKRVLVVDDSLTVRELERKLLGNRGYVVEVAVDGMDGWNAVRTGHFNLVITDIDMPRMDGIGLVSLIKKDPALKSLPVLIVSYKDREEDRRRGLEAGADYYLTKGSFHDETLLQAVVDLIGEPPA